MDEDTQDTQLLVDEAKEEDSIDDEMTPPLTQTLEAESDSESWDDYNNAGVGAGFLNFPSLVPATQLLVEKKYPIVSIKRIRDDAVS